MDVEGAPSAPAELGGLVPQRGIIYVDNIFVMGGDTAGVESVVRQICAILLEKYRLSIKPTSKETLIIRGRVGGRLCVPIPGWKEREAMLVLGHVISASGAATQAWKSVQRSAWVAFWKQGGKATCKPIGPRRLLSLLERCVWPILSFRCPLLPPRVGLLKEGATMQRKMLACALRLRPEPGEDPMTWGSRRSRALQQYLCANRRWDTRWCSLFVMWFEHCKRERERAGAGCGPLLARWATPEALANRRASLLNSSGPGRLLTRPIGGVSVRWAEAFRLSEDRILDEARAAAANIERPA